MTSIPDILAMGPVMPVIVIDDSSEAVPLAQALIDGGIRTIEITLRTAAALDSIRAVADACPDILIGAGTVTNAALAASARDAGARFLVSPGTTDAVIKGAADAGLPLLPGAASLSEIMRLMDAGFSAIKFFPAATAGGPSFVKSLASPLAGLQVCPTGGISLDSATEWLSLPNVPCVGGSWIAPQTMISAGDFRTITANARAAAALAD
jgi:2-dehydro-3-deoxyphosphogluconate aldolase/(4S)-4-hydroxy-2-oxoglutarate aldolase